MGPELEFITTRVVSAKHFPEGVYIPFPVNADDLIEIHPLGMAQLGEDDPPHLNVLVVFENEQSIHHSPAVVPCDWFQQLIPLRIFLNLPNDVANIVQAPPSLEEPPVVVGILTPAAAASLIVEIEHLIVEWSNGRQPRRRTTNLFSICAGRGIRCPDETMGEIVRICKARGRLKGPDRHIVLRSLQFLATQITHNTNS